ncbi:TetR/AcrR family transcriptional regulator [Streptomyces sp. NPDC001922]|uniref:TetR/AcrR family transcriptional regulator n=1 Tax=Streptomyces sp. NPDC001922 TaxID=3364624 RepID=UPI00368559C0
MPQTRTPDSTRRSERSRQAILDAALELVGEVGFNKLTIEAIAARAGVGKQTIYRWWPSKAAVLFDSFLALSGQEEGGPVLPDSGDLEADLKLVLRATVDELNDPKYDLPSRALTAESQNDPELARELTGRVLEPQLVAFEERLGTAREAGEVAEDTDLRVAVEMLVGPLYHRWMLRTRPLTHDFADSVVEQTLQGLRPRG